MTYDELLSTIAASSREDWITWDLQYWVYKHDLNVRFEETTEQNFDEGDRRVLLDWAQVAPEMMAGPEWRSFTVYYGTTQVETVEFADIDAGRSLVPAPVRPDRLVIPYWKYRLGKVVEPAPNDIAHGLDVRLEQAGITVEGR